MSALAGLLTLKNADTNDLVGEFQESVFVRNAKGFNVGSTLFGLMSRLSAEPADNIEYNWWERDPVRRNVFSTSGETAGAVTMDLDDGAGGDVWPILSEGHVLKNDRTGEYVRVTTDPTTGTVGIARSLGSAAAAAILDNDQWSVITLGKDEGANAVRSAYEEPGVFTNFIQTFNSSVEITNAFKGSVLRTDIEGPLRERRIQALERIANDIELAFLFGVRAQVAGATGHQYYTGGIQDTLDRAGLAANALNGQGAGGVTLQAFLDWLRSFMVYGSDMKLAFCGPQAFSVISDFANSATAGFRIMNNETIFGMNITEVMTPFGVLSLAFHPLMKHATAYDDWMVAVDLAHLTQKTFEPLFLEPNIQQNGQDSYKEQFRAKLGFKAKFPEAHGYAYDLQKLTVA
jgi:hypothetical protein